MVGGSAQAGWSGVPAVEGDDAEGAFTQGEAAQPAGEQAGEDAGGVSHEWLLATGLNLPTLPAKKGVADRAGWQTGQGPAGVAPSRTARHRRSHARRPRRQQR